MCRKIGNIIEEYATETFNLQSAPFNDYYDAMLMNIPIEIKGILKNPVDNSNRNKNGRGWIINENHLKLVDNNGMYLFVVYDYKNWTCKYNIIDYTDLNIQYILFIAAHRIKINNGSNTKISYKKLLKLI